jgi:hypothetical protein
VHSSSERSARFGTFAGSKGCWEWWWKFLDGPQALHTGVGSFGSVRLAPHCAQDDNARKFSMTSREVFDDKQGSFRWQSREVLMTKAGKFLMTEQGSFDEKAGKFLMAAQESCCC